MVVQNTSNPPPPWEGINRRIVKADIAIIDKYSAIKIKVNGPPMYSVLNPETSSDSPSAWSNGVRFVSPNIVANQIYLVGANNIKGQIRFNIFIKLNLRVI